MVIVSAGVIMNVILAAIGFMVVFLIGFKAPTTTVGSVFPESPAQKAGLAVGDTILYIDNKWQYDFSKVGLTVALLHEGEDIPFRCPMESRST
jgi:membrane-associated protease RseP (regulator of RpoE activity)